MHVGAVVHRINGGVCQPVTVTSVVRDEETGKNKLGQVRFGNVTGQPTGQRSEEAYYEGTWHNAETCHDQDNFVDED